MTRCAWRPDDGPVVAFSHGALNQDDPEAFDRLLLEFLVDTTV